MMKTWNAPEINELKITETAWGWWPSEKDIEDAFHFFNSVEPNGKDNDTFMQHTLDEWKSLFGYNDDNGNDDTITNDRS